MKNKFSNFFVNVDVDSIARETGFTKRVAKKITPLNYLLSFFLIRSNKHFSLRGWAFELSTLIGEKVSFQAIDKKLQFRHLKFVKQVFQNAMVQCISTTQIAACGDLSMFNRVLIEDSTCVKMANALYAHLSGVSNGLVKKAISRIQFCVDIKNSTYENVEMTTYSKNDISYSSSIVARIMQGDLIIRDLGYWKIKVFAEIAAIGAYFISRLRNNTSIYYLNGNRMDFIADLKKKDRKAITQFDIEAKIGKDHKQKVRIVGYKLTDKQAAIKRNAAKKARHKNCPIAKESYYLMTWNIFITNVEQATLGLDSIVKMYRLRWQIEMMFKNWESNFSIDEIMLSCKGKSPVRPEILL